MLQPPPRSCPYPPLLLPRHRWLRKTGHRCEAHRSQWWHPTEGTACVLATWPGHPLTHTQGTRLSLRSLTVSPHSVNKQDQWP